MDANSPNTKSTLPWMIATAVALVAAIAMYSSHRASEARIAKMESELKRMAGPEPQPVAAEPEPPPPPPPAPPPAPPRNPDTQKFVADNHLSLDKWGILHRANDEYVVMLKAASQLPPNESAEMVKRAVGAREVRLHAVFPEPAAMKKFFAFEPTAMGQRFEVVGPDGKKLTAVWFE